MSGPLRRRPRALDLYWIPLGAGASVVRHCGRLYERVAALLQRRPPRALFHSALVADTPEGTVTVEMAPIPDAWGRRDRGVVGEGAVGSRWLGAFRTFRYENRRWVGGAIPDLPSAIGGPVRITEDAATIEAIRRGVEMAPTPVWGRDELGAGEMWNSNSLIAWVLTRAGATEAAGRPPDDGRAPGWDAGVLVGQRALEVTNAPTRARVGA